LRLAASRDKLFTRRVEMHVMLVRKEARVRSQTNPKRQVPEEKIGRPTNGCRTLQLETIAKLILGDV